MQPLQQVIALLKGKTESALRGLPVRRMSTLLLRGSTGVNDSVTIRLTIRKDKSKRYE